MHFEAKRGRRSGAFERDSSHFDSLDAEPEDVYALIEELRGSTATALPFSEAIWKLVRSVSAPRSGRTPSWTAISASFVALIALRPAHTEANRLWPPTRS